MFFVLKENKISTWKALGNFYLLACRIDKDGIARTFLPESVTDVL